MFSGFGRGFSIFSAIDCCRRQSLAVRLEAELIMGLDPAGPLIGPQGSKEESGNVPPSVSQLFSALFAVFAYFFTRKKSQKTPPRRRPGKPRTQSLHTLQQLLGVCRPGGLHFQVTLPIKRPPRVRRPVPVPTTRLRRPLAAFTALLPLLAAFLPLQVRLQQRLAPCSGVVRVHCSAGACVPPRSRPDARSTGQEVALRRPARCKRSSPYSNVVINTLY